MVNIENILTNHYFSIMSGFAASLASFFGKMMTWTQENNSEISLIQQGVFFGLMLASNAMVWRYFVRGLHANDNSTLIPTVISNASNYIVSGFLGVLIFKEITNFLWWIGASMIFLGMFLIISEDERIENKHNKIK